MVKKGLRLESAMECADEDKLYHVSWNILRAINKIVFICMKQCWSSLMQNFCPSKKVNKSSIRIHATTLWKRCQTKSLTTEALPQL